MTAPKNPTKQVSSNLMESDEPQGHAGGMRNDKVAPAGNYPDAPDPRDIRETPFNGRDRPVHHRGEAELRFAILDDMEKAGQMRLTGGQRVPLTPKLKLEWNDCEPGFNYQWGSDAQNYPVSLQQMCDAGYTFVRHKHGAIAGQPVIQNSKGCSLYLMRIPENLFIEDEQAKHKRSLDQYQAINTVGAREYAGDSKEMGKGKPVKLEFDDTPEAIKLMEGDDD